ncbi:MAG: B12-binding domain-containing radical SAM protein [Candidatus Schekmanbacteria bacterium]|nr:B12-binding domain-containing radical SAM protein [Candidatus Schekmanbacteria bacterium]
MRVVLVNNFESNAIESSERIDVYPVGLLTLAGVLRNCGHDVEVVDFTSAIGRGEIPYDENVTQVAAERLLEREPDVIGFTSRCDSYYLTLGLMRWCRTLHPDLPLVLGGPQATITCADTMENFPFVDFIVRHEGEEALPQFLQSLDGCAPFHEVCGLSYRSRGNIHHNPDQPVISDLDKYPIPAFDLFPPETNTAGIEVGRGCPYSCTFCSTSRFFARRFRLKSPQRIVAEMTALHQAYRITHFQFHHDMFTTNHSLVLDVCNEIRRSGLPVTWSCSSRIDRVSPSLMNEMREAGCSAIYFGIETGSAEMQLRLNKRIPLDKVFHTLMACSECGIKSTTSFIVGFPNESRSDVEDTLRMLGRCSSVSHSTQLHVAVPLPGSELLSESINSITFTGYIGDVSNFGIRMPDDFADTVRKLPSVFSAYYHFVPQELSLDDLHGIDKFFMSTFRFWRETILCLLHDGIIKSLLELYQRFRSWARHSTKWNDSSQVVRPILSCAYLLRRFLPISFLGSGISKLSLSREAFKYNSAVMQLGLQGELARYSPTSSDSVITTDTVLHPARTCVVSNFLCNVDVLLSSVRCEQFDSVTISDTESWVAVCEGPMSRETRKPEVIQLDDWMKAVLFAVSSRKTPVTIGRNLWNLRSKGAETSLEYYVKRTFEAAEQLVQCGLIMASSEESDHSQSKVRVMLAEHLLPWSWGIGV